MLRNCARYSATGLLGVQSLRESAMVGAYRSLAVVAYVKIF
jgi:hypothetical protein